jgi:hypothetical protein
MSPAYQPAGSGPVVLSVIVTVALWLAETFCAASLAQA